MNAYLIDDAIQYIIPFCDAPTKFVLRLTSNVFYRCIPITDIHKERYNLCRIASTYSSPYVLQVLRDFGWLSNEDSFTAAATTGNLEVLEWLWNDGCNYPFSADIAIGESGNLDVLKWLHGKDHYSESSYPYIREFYGACKCGSISMIEFIVDIVKDVIGNTIWKGYSGLKLCAERGHRGVLELALKNGYVPGNMVWCAAIKGGQRELLEWLSTLSICIPLCHGMLDAAMKGGNESTIEWVVNALGQTSHADGKMSDDKERYGRIDLIRMSSQFHCCSVDNIVVRAIEVGDISAVEWALRNCNLQVTSRLCCEAAAHHNRLKILKLLRQYGFVWCNRITTIAALKGNLEILTWAIDNGCECSDDIMVGACSGGNVRVVEYLISKGYRRNNYSDCVITAINNGHTDMAKYLCDNYDISGGWEDFHYKSIGANNITMLSYIHNKNSRSMSSRLYQSYEKVELETIRWLVAKGYKIDSSSIYACSISADNVRVFGWLLDRGYKMGDYALSKLRRTLPKRVSECARKHGLL